MVEDARGAVPEEMDGLSREAATERILEREDPPDRDVVRDRLGYVTTDGVVCRDGIEDGLTEVTEIISTPETRIDLARQEFETATDLAEPVVELPVVASRLDSFEERLMWLKEETDRLGPELNELFNEWLAEPDDVYAMADSLHRHATRGRRMGRLIDELIADLESFQGWLREERVRFDELERDVDGIDDSLEDIEGTLAELSVGSDPGSHDDGDQGSESPTESGERDPALVWVDAAMRHRLVGLLIEDIEAELRGLRAWPDATDEERADAIADRIAGLRRRWTALEDRVDAVARSAWRERFGGSLEAFEADLDDVSPPIDWGEVQQTLEDHRTAVGSGRTERQ